MISERIANAAQKAIPVEKRIARFFDRQSNRLILSGIAAAIIAAVMVNAMWLVENGYFLLETLFVGILISLVGCFLSNIGKFSVRKFVVMTLISSVVVFVGITFVATLRSTILSEGTLYRDLVSVGLWHLPQFVTALVIILAFTAIVSTRRRESKT